VQLSTYANQGTNANTMDDLNSRSALSVEVLQGHMYMVQMLESERTLTRTLETSTRTHLSHGEEMSLKMLLETVRIAQMR
jgi:hypothetical protein